MSALKILLLSRWYWLEDQRQHDDEPGTTRQLAETVALLGHEVVVLSQSYQVRKMKRIPLGKLETWVFPREKARNVIVGLRDRMGRRAFSYPTLYTDALALRDFIKQRGPFDVLWAHAEATDGLVAAMATRLGAKLPPVLVQVQHMRRHLVKGVQVYQDKRAIDLAFRQATRILANSDMAAAAIPQAYATPGHSAEDLNAKVRVVYPNIKNAFLKAGQETPPASKPNRVLFLGTLDASKGAFVFLQAIVKTEVSRKTSNIVVIGDFPRPSRRAIRRWEKAQEAARVQLSGATMEYLGEVSTFEVVRQIKLASLVVVPSLYEPFSRSVVEALILGRPVITTDQVGACELLTKHQCGIVVPPNDPDALAQAIDTALHPSVPIVENAKEIGWRLTKELAPESIAPYIAYHLGRIATTEQK
jgi:glycosyltransferase involved in cell wall biosynthesis